MDSNLDELVELFIPHTDEGSTSNFHMWPDIATNGSVILMTWHRCPLIDNQGNAAECDIDVQFASVQPDRTIIALENNQIVNTGDPAGTINIRPSAAMNSTGNSVIIWVDTRTGAQGDIFGQRFDPNGQPQGANFQISQGHGQIDVRPNIRPEVALLDDGRAMIVWSDSSAEGFTAWGRQYVANGDPLEAPQRLGLASLPHRGHTASDGKQQGYLLVRTWFSFGRGYINRHTC